MPGHIIWKALVTASDEIQMKEMKQSEKNANTHSDTYNRSHIEEKGCAPIELN